MSFVAYTLPAAATVVGGAISAKGSKDAAKTAAGGSREEIAFNRESRDLVRADQAPYRKAGYTALDALMSLTGLGGGGGGSSAITPTNVVPDIEGINGRAEPARLSYRSAYEQPRTQYRFNGGAIDRGSYCNINELGPENVYSGGAITRNPNPMTIDGRTGYVEPNIQGRAVGGFTQPTEPPIMVPPSAPPATPVQPPAASNQLPGNTAQVPNQIPGNTANSTAINPQTGYPNENPGGEPGGYQFETDPGYQFRFSEGQRALDRGAAARGGLLSGGYARKAIRYGQGFATNEFTNVFNRIANIAGIGQTANQASGNATMYGGAAMGNAASNAGNATAYGQIGAGNAWANAGNELARMPWGNVFNQQPRVATNAGGTAPQY